MALIKSIKTLDASKRIVHLLDSVKDYDKSFQKSIPMLTCSEYPDLGIYDKKKNVLALYLYMAWTDSNVSVLSRPISLENSLLEKLERTVEKYTVR